MRDEKYSIGEIVSDTDRLLDKINASKYSFIIVLDGSAYRFMYEYMLADLYKCENVTFVIDEKNNSGLKNILMRDKVRKYLKGKFDFLTIERNCLFDAISSEVHKTENIVVIFLNAALYYNNYLAGNIKYYKRKWPTLKTVLFYLDIIGIGVCKNADYLREKNLFDLVYTVDANDAERINAVKWQTFYSVDTVMDQKVAAKDLYFCGALKDRAKLLKHCAELATDSGILIEMDVICDRQDHRMETFPGINIHNFGRYICYQEVLEKELEAKCILEIVQKGQTALTLRPYEAVVYNRKLLTNNKEILDFSFYDHRYMRYFEKLEDIDWDWIKEDVVVDYGYRGEFSPVYLLEDIVRRMCEHQWIQK